MSINVIKEGLTAIKANKQAFVQIGTVAIGAVACASFNSVRDGIYWAAQKFLPESVAQKVPSNLIAGAGLAAGAVVCSMKLPVWAGLAIFDLKTNAGLAGAVVMVGKEVGKLGKPNLAHLNGAIACVEKVEYSTITITAAGDIADGFNIVYSGY